MYRATFRVAIKITHALTLLILSLERLVLAGGFLNWGTTSDIRGWIAWMARELVRLFYLRVCADHDCTTRVYDSHRVTCQECTPAIRSCSGHIIILLLAWIGQLTKNFRLHVSILHHVFKDCIRYFTGFVDLIIDLFKHELVYFIVLWVTRATTIDSLCSASCAASIAICTRGALLASSARSPINASVPGYITSLVMHKNVDLLTTVLDHSKMWRESRYNLFSKFCLHELTICLVFLSIMLKHQSVSKHLLFRILLFS